MSEKTTTANSRGKLTIFLVSLQCIFIALFAVLVEYHPRRSGPSNHTLGKLSEENREDATFYPLYQDVHVMILIGIGFLIAFLKRHGLGSVGFNMLILCFVTQWSIIINGLFESIATSSGGSIYLTVKSLLFADFAAATVLISFCCVLGVVTPVQTLIMALFETVFYNACFLMCEHFKVVDVGGTIVIHVFAVYFGLAVAMVVARFTPWESSKEDTSYNSEMFAMIGSLFLWAFWPTFNSCLAVGNERFRAVINTLLSLSACTTMVFATDCAINKNNKFTMGHVQNAALTGGVAMGASADLLVEPYAALIIGAITGVASVLGFCYVQPFLQRKIGLHDSCGAHNVHGIPGIIGAVASAIIVSQATEEHYQDSYSTAVRRGSASEQAAYQIYGLLATIAFSLVTGALTGLIMCLPWWDRMETEDLYEDATFWECEEDTSDSKEAEAYTMCSV